MEQEHLAPARDAIHDLFLEHVMAHAPGYDKLISWTDAPIMPTPGAVGNILQQIAEQRGVNAVGVDIGGTFTEVALVNETDGQIGIAKVPTTPRDFGEGVVQALEIALRENGVAADEVTLLSHATPVVTNAILEGKGARTVLVSTHGFRDVLEIRRSARADLYDLFQDPPGILVPRHCRLEVTERIDAAGDVVTPLDETEIDDIVSFIRENDIEAVSVSLLYSFLN